MVEVVFALGFYCIENLIMIGSLFMPGKGFLCDLAAQKNKSDYCKRWPWRSFGV